MTDLRRKSAPTAYSSWFSAPALIIYSIFVVLPVLISLVFSFTDWNVLRMYEPEFRGLHSYTEVLNDGIFTHALFNTLIYAFSSTILKIVVGLLLALVLAKPLFGNNIFRTVYYMPCVLSCTVVGVLFTSILAKNGLFNNSLSTLGLGSLQQVWLGKYGSAMIWIILVDVWMWAGFNMFIFISGLQAIPKDYYEYASTEGVNSWHQFWHITLPLLVPSITVNVTLNISGGLKVFDIVYVLTNGGPGFDTQMLATYVYRDFAMGYLGESCAASIILSILVVIISFAMNRYLTEKEVEA